MDNANKNRIISYSTLLGICIICVCVGVFCYFNGYGTEGAVRKELSPIIDSFNELNNIKNNTAKVKASFKESTIVIEYDDGAIKKEFVVNYNQFGSNTTLSGQINSGNSSVNNMLVESIIQAVSISQGDTTNSIAGLYDLDKEDFKYNGKAISYNQQTYIFSVQLNVNLLEDVRNNQVTDTPVKPEVDNKDENNQTVVTPSN